MTTKLPQSDVPLIQDPDLAAALEREISGYSGKSLERAQAAIRKVHGSGVIGPYDTILGAYRQAIREAVNSKGGSDG